MENYRERLNDILRTACTAERFAWLEQALEKIRSSDDVENELANLSAMTRRKMGDTQLPPEPGNLTTPIGPLVLEHWSAADAARALLILQAMEVSGDQGPAAVNLLFRHGDEMERATIARALALFDDGTELKHLIVEAGRANSLQLVSAASLENPYPCAHYSEPEFNQLVLKNLFLGLPIDQVVGLEQRANAELSRMCEDYYDERTAANRDTPNDIWLAMGPYASERAITLMTDHLSHDSPTHRCYAAIAIGRKLAELPQLREVLEQQKKTESDARVLEALQAALAD